MSAPVSNPVSNPVSAAWQRLSLRARLLLIGVAGLATALAVGSVALYGVLTLVSYRTLDASANATGREVADLADLSLIHI